MDHLTSLRKEAEKEQIPIIPYALPQTGSLALQLDNGQCYIGIDYDRLQDPRDQAVHLGHELGHCLTGAFYNRYAKIDLRQRQEIKADKWAIHRLVPMEELDDAIARGLTEFWELAEYFGVTVDFMKKAVCLYTHGNLEADLYF